MRINWQNLKKSDEAVWILVDLFMLGLLIFNFVFIIFDSLYETRFFNSFFTSMSPELVEAYLPIHENFVLIDLGFVAVFLTEFVLRWVVAVRRHDFMRWYFFPFVHWYDLIGCIPVSSLRILRVLRIVSILYRLHRYEIINLKNTAVVKFCYFYYNVLIEELSDRIIVRALSDVQRDIQEGSPVFDEIVEKVLAKRRETLNQWSAAILNHAGASIEDADSGQVLRAHVGQSVAKAVQSNPQVGLLSAVPIVGSNIEKLLETAVTDIVVQSLINLLVDVTPAKIDDIVQHGITATSAHEQALDKEVLQMLSECLELVKVHVSGQRWKTHLASES